LPEKVDLNFSNQLRSFCSSSPNTATIPAQDFPVFTTDSQQSPWPPSSSSSLPATSALQLHLQHLDLPPSQQDFVLFDQPIKQHRQPSRLATQPSAIGGVNQHNQQHRSPQQFYQNTPAPASSLQNQRVANIIQATGHQTTSSAFTNRFSSSAQNPHSHQFYASSAPSSSVALNLQNTQTRPPRPPVPLFSQSTGSISQGKMNIQGNEHPRLSRVPVQHSLHHRSDLDFDEFTAFGGGASTAYSSPALPSVFDVNTSAPSSTTTNMGTVSPQDLLIQEPFMSAPNSTALTALTSPSLYGESPEFGDGFDVSPNFGSSEFDPNSADVWFPLFPQETTQKPQSKVSSADQSPAEKSDDLEVAEPRSGHQRRKSGSSPPSGRHSSVSGVNARKRDKPLPPIIIEDPNDVVAMKRARNTLAARKSRERKAQKLEELEEKIEKLKQERDHWKQLALAHGAQQE
ncbi:cross-pathway control protein 1, partial [Diplogelasinospora grovesii]